MADHKKADYELALVLSVTMNDTFGQKGRVPSALVLGEFQEIRTQGSKTKPPGTLLSRKAMAEMAHKEMEKHIAKVKINLSLNHMIPKTLNRSYQPGDRILVWR